MQDTLTQKPEIDLAGRPTRIRVIGYTYLVDFGPSTQPRFHTVNKQRSCSCPLKETCPAIEAVAEYLRNGGQRAPDPMPPARSAARRLSVIKSGTASTPKSSAGAVRQEVFDTSWKPKPNG
jgi:hypothetical protein